jgi:hypothetical protein
MNLQQATIKVNEIAKELLETQTYGNGFSISFRAGRKIFLLDICEETVYTIYTAHYDESGDLCLRTGKKGKSFRTVENFVNLYK